MTDDKKFGISLSAALAVIGGLACWRGHADVSLAFGTAGAVSLAVLLLAPALMRYPRRLLMAVGWLNSKLVLVLVFYLVFTPAGLLMRIFRKDQMARRRDKNLDSYWILRAPAEYDPRSTERQY